jgi:3-hydroxybutyryl-CoA dehydratase
VSGLALDFDQLEVGAAISSRGRTIGEGDLTSFAALTGDWHPQHSDAEWAAQSPFGERIAHGMLIISYALGLLPIDPERVVALRGIRSVVFKRPVAIGTTIRVEAEISGLRPLDSEHGLVELALRVRDGERRLVARGLLEVLWRRDPDAGRIEDAARPTELAELELSPLAAGRVLL